MRNKNQLPVITALVLLASFSLIFTACLLGGDIETIRATAADGRSVVVPGENLAEKLSWLEDYAWDGGNFIVEVNADEIISPHFFNYDPGESNNVTITMKGISANRKISISSNGSFIVGKRVTLILDNNITLLGRDDNDKPLVEVSSGGTLIMNTGSAITGNNNKASTSYSYDGDAYYGGGVFVSNYDGTNWRNNSVMPRGREFTGGTFIMNGGTISGNTGSGGGGVCSIGTFTMSGGTISGNTTTTNGGGVYVERRMGSTFIGGTFTKTGGTIYGYSESDPVNSNVVKNHDYGVVNNRGHAVFANGKRKETTAGPGVDLSFDGSVDPPTFSGEWDY